MCIVRWEQIGNPIVLAEGYGKTLSKQQFRDHQGNVVDFFFVDPPSFSIVVPITGEGNVVLVRQYKQGADRILEELPGGTAASASESPAEMMRRELREETGYEAGELISVGSGWVNSRHSHARFYCFLATGCTRVASPCLDSSEQIEVIERPLGEWIEMVLTWGPEWESCVTTFRALPYLGMKLQVGHTNL